MGVGQRFQSIFATQTARIGTSITLKRTTTAAYNPATSQATTSSTSYTVKGVFESSMSQFNMGQWQGSFVTQDGTDIRAQRKVFLIPSLETDGVALPFVPSVGDMATVDGRDYRISDTETETADDVVVFHRLFMEFA